MLKIFTLKGLVSKAGLAYSCLAEAHFSYGWGFLSQVLPKSAAAESADQ